MPREGAEGMQVMGLDCGMKLGPYEILDSLGAGGKTSVEAYDLYLRGRASIQPPAGQENFAVASFEHAIAKDPLFAPAYAGLAAIRALRSGLFSLDAKIQFGIGCPPDLTHRPR